MDLSKLTYAQLADCAEQVAVSITTETETGYSIVDHSTVKPMAKIYLWMNATSNEDYQKILAENKGLESVRDLYFYLEDIGAFEVSKKDLVKYKWYTETVYSHVKKVQEINNAVMMKTLFEIKTLENVTTDGMAGLTRAFDKIGKAIYDLNEEALKEKAESIAETVSEVLL